MGEGHLVNSEFEYIGGFEEDSFHGEGTKKFLKDDKKLVGQFYGGPFVGDDVVYKKCKYQGKVISEKMHGPGKMSFLNDFEFIGNFENDRIRDDYPKNKLVNLLNKKEFIVYFKYSSDLGSDLFTTAGGDVFTVDFDKGIVLKIK